MGWSAGRASDILRVSGAYVDCAVILSEWEGSLSFHMNDDRDVSHSLNMTTRKWCELAA
jgi:hypothetical protein